MANETDAQTSAAKDSQASAQTNVGAAQTDDGNGSSQSAGQDSKNILDTLGEGANKVFMAGVGALVVGAQKGKELVEQLASKGQESIGQGKDINKELTHKAGQATKNIRESALEMRMKAMTPEERIQFANKAAQLAEEQNLAQAQSQGAVDDERIDIDKATQAAEKLEG